MHRFPIGFRPILTLASQVAASPRSCPAPPVPTRPGGEPSRSSAGRESGRIPKPEQRIYGVLAKKKRPGRPNFNRGRAYQHVPESLTIEEPNKREKRSYRRKTGKKNVSTTSARTSPRAKGSRGSPGELLRNQGPEKRKTPSPGVPVPRVAPTNPGDSGSPHCQEFRELRPDRGTQSGQKRRNPDLDHVNKRASINHMMLYL